VAVEVWRAAAVWGQVSGGMLVPQLIKVAGVLCAEVRRRCVHPVAALPGSQGWVVRMSALKSSIRRRRFNSV
jgi:hypothetical protein